ncbi:MAG TPA: ankyrin repeat domain-containing protein [Fimbriimonas sp.]
MEPGPVLSTIVGSPASETHRSFYDALQAQHRRVQKVLEEGADSNERTPSGGTVLGTAVTTKDAALAELLLRHGADPYLEDEKAHEGSAMRIAAKKGNTDLVRLMLKYGGPPRHHPDKIPLIADAANVEVAKLLMPPKEMMAFRHRRGASLISYHAYQKRYEVLKMLLEEGANEVLKKPASELVTDDPRILALLLKHGADSNLGWDSFGIDHESSKRYAVIEAARRRYWGYAVLSSRNLDPLHSGF